MSEKRPGAQMRLLHESINPNSGHWVENSTSWQEATPALLNSWQKHIASNITRADRQNWRFELWRFELRHFDIETFTVTAEVRWEEIENWVNNPNVHDVPDPIRVVIVGNPLDGFVLYGPFDSNEDANRFGGSLNEEWWTAHVGRPV